MDDFWELSFKRNTVMWGKEPADAAVMVANSFKVKGYDEILIPGCGYGRNALPFIAMAMNVTGIEISATAIAIASNLVPDKFKIYNGNVTDMPFDQKLYDGIFCYSLLHLLNSVQRSNLVRNCYNQLNIGGSMAFVTLSTNDHQFGKGTKISKNHYLSKHHIELYFHDTASIHKEFSDYGISDVREIIEPVKGMKNALNQRLWMITCTK